MHRKMVSMGCIMFCPLFPVNLTLSPFFTFLAPHSLGPLFRNQFDLLYFVMSLLLRWRCDFRLFLISLDPFLNEDDRIYLIFLLQFLRPSLINSLFWTTSDFNNELNLSSINPGVSIISFLVNPLQELGDLNSDGLGNEGLSFGISPFMRSS